MTLIRLFASLFILVLITVSVMGWAWNGAHQAAGLATAGRIVLALCGLAGVVGLVALWRWPRRS